MPKWINSTLLISSIIFFAIAIYVIYMNRGDKIYQSTLPVVLVGAVTLFLSNFIQLKETKLEYSFFSTMVISDKRDLPYRVDFYDGTNLHLQRQEDYGLSAFAINKHDGFGKGAMVSSNSLCISLLQHKILNHFLTRTNNGLRIQKETGINILTKREAYFPDDLVKAVDVLSHDTVDSYLESASPRRIQRNMISLPDGTEVIVSSKHLEEITIKKRNYFEITIRSKLIYDSSKMHKIVALNEVYFDDDFYTKVMKTEIMVKFSKISSLSEKQDHYRKWVDYLVALAIDEFDDSDGRDGKLQLVIQPQQT